MEKKKFEVGKPILEKEYYYKPFLKLINGIFDDIIFRPILEVLKPIQKYYFNSENVIIEAIRSGQIQYINGKFYGKFNAKISKELVKLGAKYNKLTKTYDIEKQLLPLYVRDSIAYMSVFYADMAKKLNYVIDNIEFNQLYPNLKKIFEYELEDVLIEDLEDESEKTLKSAFKKTSRGKKKTVFEKLKEKTKFKELEESIKIVPELNKTIKAELVKNYIDNVNYSIAKFTDEARLKLRKMVMDNLFKNGGLQIHSLVEELRKFRGVDEKRAEFIARQDTSLLIAEYRKAKYKQLGITEYIWNVARTYEATKDRPHGVRPEHWALKDTRQSFDNPPVSNKKGERHNPGEDFGCRCYPLPIIEYNNML